MHVTSPYLTYPCSHSHHRREVVSLHPFRQLAVFRRYPLALYGMLQSSDPVSTQISISERLHKTVFVSISYNDSPATVCIFVTCLKCSILYSTSSQYNRTLRVRCNSQYCINMSFIATPSICHIQYMTVVFNYHYVSLIIHISI